MRLIAVWFVAFFPQSRERGKRLSLRTIIMKEKKNG